MSLRTWILVFIFSTLASLEVLWWAISHGQFDQPERARWLALRRERLRPVIGRSLTPVKVGLWALTLVWAASMAHLLWDAYWG